jgi:soluble lytic murein transglycosylase-like protein
MVGDLRLPASQAAQMPSKFSDALGRCSVGASATVRDPALPPAVKRIDEPPREVVAPGAAEPVREPVMPRSDPPALRLPAERMPSERPASERPTPMPKVRAPDAGALVRMREADAVLAPAAARNDIDPLLLHAVAWVESRHRPEAVSPAGARGLMQVMPQTGARFGVQSERHLHEPAFNAAAAAAYLKWLQGEFGNDLSLVLAAYNAGEGAVRRHGLRVPPYPETTAYVRDVLAVYRELATQAREAASATPRGDAR